MSFDNTSLRNEKWRTSSPDEPKLVEATVIPEKIIIRCGTFLVSLADARDGFGTISLIDGYWPKVKEFTIDTFKEGEPVNVTMKFFPETEEERVTFNAERRERLIAFRDDVVDTVNRMLEELCK
jgi:hypothetical protein